MWRNFILYVRDIKAEGSFIRNVSIASSWNVAVIISQFVLSPITTRLYDPSQYGIYALFNSIVVNVALFSTLKYSDTIVLAESDEQRDNSVALSMLGIITISLGSLLIISIWNNEVVSMLNAGNASTLFYFIPLGIFLTSTMDVTLAVNIRRKKFFNNGMAGFLNGTSARVYNILHGVVLSPRAIGLIAGDFLGKTVGIGAMLMSFQKIRAAVSAFFSRITWTGMKRVAKKYKSFPLYFLPSSVLIYLSGHLPLYFFQIQYGSDIVGAFALASSMLEIFNRLIPYALSPVFLQKANELKNISLNHLATRTYRLFGYVLILATVIFAGMALLSKTFFPILFGENWTMAGAFAAVLSVQYAFNFIAVALSEIYNVVGGQRFLFFNSIFNVVLKLVCFLAIFYMNISALAAVFVYSVISSLGGISLVLGVFIILKHNVWKVLGIQVVALLIILLTLFLGELI